MKVTLLKILDTKTGEGKNGLWKRVQFLAKTDAQYNNEVPFEAMNKVADEILAIPVGAELDIMYNLAGNEWNGKHYVKAEVWKIAELTGNVHPAQEAAPSTSNPKADVPARATESAGDESDLPF